MKMKNIPTDLGSARGGLGGLEHRQGGWCYTLNLLLMYARTCRWGQRQKQTGSVHVKGAFPVHVLHLSPGFSFPHGCRQRGLSDRSWRGEFGGKCAASRIRWSRCRDKMCPLKPLYVVCTKRVVGVLMRHVPVFTSFMGSSEFWKRGNKSLNFLHRKWKCRGQMKKIHL